MPFDQSTMVFPDGTRFFERHIRADGDVVIADRSSIEFGVETPARVFLGEGVRVLGGVTAAADVHADLFSYVEGDITSQGSVFLGERAHIRGKLSVAGDLDVGDDVKIEQGFETRGWINIRNPIPTVVYVFLYLMQLLNAGRSEEVERVLGELSATEDMFHVSDTFMYVPTGSYVGLESSIAKGPLRVGEGSRVLGNFEVGGFASIGANTSFHGALRAQGDVHLGPGCEVHGDVASSGHVAVGPGTRVHGALTASTLELHPGALVLGTVTAPKGMRFVTPESEVAAGKVDAFRAGKTPDLVRLLE